MMNYFDSMYNYLLSFVYNKSESPKFEKPRAYKNIACHEIRLLKK
jgi:hypothetical protein